MCSSTGAYFMNQSFEDDKPTSAKFVEQKENTNHAETETGHAKPSQGSNRILLRLVIIACLISLAVLLLTILMFWNISGGRDSAANEGSSSTSSKSLISDSAEKKALAENMTSFQLAMMTNIESVFTELKSHLEKTNKDLEELNDTVIGKMDNLDSAFNELTSRLRETKFSGCQGACKNGKINYTADEESTSECVCDPGFYGKYCEKAAKSCKEIFDVYNFTTSRLVTLRLGPVPISVLCHVGDCGDGAWTPVMKINGSKTTFHYDSHYWSNRVEYNFAGGETGFDTQETKLPTYWNTSFNKICLGMKINQQIRFITINTTETSSLYSLIADGNYSATSLGRDTWKTLIGSEASLQYNCNKEGFNAACSAVGSSKARIGLLGNENHDCYSCDSRIGFGTGGNPDSNTCGNEAKWSPDNGDKSIKAMGYILVQ